MEMNGIYQSRIQPSGITKMYEYVYGLQSDVFNNYLILFICLMKNSTELLYNICSHVAILYQNTHGSKLNDLTS